MEEFHEELNKIGEYYHDARLSDIIFVFPDSVSNQVIPAHRLVLALRSNAFQEAFLKSHTSKPSKQLRLPIKILVKDVSVDIFTAVLQFIYRNTLPESETRQPMAFMLEVLRASVLYQVPSLCTVCVENLERLLNPETLMEMLIALDSLTATTERTESRRIIETLQTKCEELAQSLDQAAFQKLMEQSELQNACTTMRLTGIFRLRSKTPLLLAIQSGLLRVVDALISSGEPIDDESKYKEMPLIAALKFGDNLITRRLLVGNHSERLITTGNEIPTFLHLAAADGSVVHCKLLLDRKTEDANSMLTGKTPLHLASEYGNSQVVQMLLRMGNAVPNLPDRDGNTALHLAQNEETIKYLLDEKANLNIPNNRGQVPLHVAAARGDVAIANLLLLNDADPTLMDDQGQTPLHVAAAHGSVAIVLILLKSAEDKSMDETETPPLDDDGFDINAVDAKGNSALHLAAMSSPPGCEKVIRILLENGSDPNIGNWIGQTPLHLFCAHQDGPGSIIEIFIENGAKLDLQGADGSTPLHLAVGRPSEEISIALVRGGAQLHQCDMANRTVIDLAESTSQGNLVVPLLRNVATPPDWLPDDSVSNCSICQMGFSVATRKHHCRHCGLIVCYNCSTQSITLPKFDMNKPVRVCQLCYDVLSFRRLL